MDPTGEFLWVISGAGAGAVVGVFDVIVNGAPRSSIIKNMLIGGVTGGVGFITKKFLYVVISEGIGLGFNAITSLDSAVDSINDYPNINKITKPKDYIEIINYMDHENSSCKTQ